MHENMRQKDTVPIRVSCVNGDEFRGNVYLEHAQRLSDLMNDHRAFLPVQQEDGALVVIAKSAIMWVNEALPAANQN
jgi:hypothetical protein